MGGMYKKALETGICFCRGRIGGTWRRDSYTRDFERNVRFFLIRSPCLFETPKNMRKKALEAGISLFVGEPGGGSFTGDFKDTDKRRLWKW
jgi:hypothetical protein